MAGAQAPPAALAVFAAARAGLTGGVGQRKCPPWPAKGCVFVCPLRKSMWRAGSANAILRLLFGGGGRVAFPPSMRKCLARGQCNSFPAPTVRWHWGGLRFPLHAKLEGCGFAVALWGRWDSAPCFVPRPVCGRRNGAPSPDVRWQRDGLWFPPPCDVAVWAAASRLPFGDDGIVPPASSHARC